MLLLSGDFRQTLLIIPKGTRTGAVRACLKSSHLWHLVYTFSLTSKKYSVYSDLVSAKFAEDISTIGKGKMPVNPLHLSTFRNTAYTIKELITKSSLISVEIIQTSSRCVKGLF